MVLAVQVSMTHRMADVKGLCKMHPNNALLFGWSVVVGLAAVDGENDENDDVVVVVVVDVDCCAHKCTVGPLPKDRPKAIIRSHLRSVTKY